MVNEVNILKIKESLQKNISKLNGKKIIVIGDVGLDEYVMGNVHRISPEAPVPVLEVKEEFCKLGLSTNVAQNLKAMGGEPMLISLMGEDLAGQKMADLLNEHNISSEHLVRSSSRPTTRKIRMMSEMHHMVRVDYESKIQIDQDLVDRVKGIYKELLKEAEAVIVQDYAKGLLDEKLIGIIISEAKKEGLAVFVDPHISKSPTIYKKAHLMTPNLKEALALGQSPWDIDTINEEQIWQLGKDLQKTIESPAMIITRSKDGMTLFEDNKVIQVPTFARQVYDVSGAGDTVIAAVALAQAAGLSLEESCVFANFAAGLVVQKVGAASAKQEDILHYMNSY